MKKVTRKTILSVVAVFVAISFVGITAVAQANGRAANIKSTGIIDFKDGAAVIDTTDFIYLANEIDLLESTYKTEIVSSLNEMGTYFTSEGFVTHNVDESMILPESAEVLAFSQLTDGILNSQSIPEDKSYSGILPGSDETVTGTLSAASADNLSLGTAAWVNGELLCGTGGDNSSYYNQGYAQGVADALDSVTIQYTYHEHNGDSTACVGCYTTPVYHSHSSSCYYQANKGDLVDTGGVYRYYTCSHCGYSKVVGDGVNDNGASSINCPDCILYGRYKCGKSTNTIEKYSLSCGKTTSTIETAILTF